MAITSKTQSSRVAGPAVRRLPVGPAFISEDPDLRRLARQAELVASGRDGTSPPESGIIALLAAVIERAHEDATSAGYCHGDAECGYYDEGRRCHQPGCHPLATCSRDFLRRLDRRFAILGRRPDGLGAALIVASLILGDDD
jgi:hypothetical protein